MFAADFQFDNNLASDFDLIIGAFDDDVETATGGEIEFNVVKTPNSNRYDFYGAQFNTVLTWNFSVIKNPCTHSHEELYFSQYEESQIAKWLLRTDGYKWFYFLQDGYEDICYKVQINMVPHQVWGRTVGFDLTVTSDCGYGYSKKKVKKYVLNSNTPIKLFVNSDISDYILPYVEVNGTGNFYISNDNDLFQCKSNYKSTELQNVNGLITMDSENELITGLSSPNDFNWYFLRLVNGSNIISTDSANDIKIKITYREPRRVIV